VGLATLIAASDCSAHVRITYRENSNPLPGCQTYGDTSKASYQVDQRLNLESELESDGASELSKMINESE